MKLNMPTPTKPSFLCLEDMVVECFEAVRPAERLTVSQAAANYRYLNNPGSYVGKWKNEKTPYLVEPMDTMTSDEFDTVVFIGPAQAGKTDMALNFITYLAVCDPADLMMVLPSMVIARDFSVTKSKPFLRYTEDVGKRVMSGRQNQNLYDVNFKSGMRVSYTWPTINNLSSKTLRYVWLTDYDRMAEDIDGEGEAFGLAQKRTTVYGMYGTTIVESSPGRELSKSNWLPDKDHPHEAPPVSGICSIYNQGDRRRYLWQCFKCRHAFEPSFRHMSYPDTGDPMEAGEAAVMLCPNCGFIIRPDMKSEINAKGRWIREGQLWLPDGSVTGKFRRSNIASFWLKGPAAFGATWAKLVSNYVGKLQEYERTGDSAPLKTTMNVDQAELFVPPRIATARTPESLRERTVVSEPRTVPHGVRFLIAAVDVQKRAFRVQVHGIGAGGDIWIIDSFAIRDSERLDDAGRPMFVDPAAYLEDWKLLVDQVIKKPYPLADDSGRVMYVKTTVCDSAGARNTNADSDDPSGGVTEKAYKFFRWLRREHGEGLHWRFQLLKGSTRPAAPRIEMRFPDAENKNRVAKALGEIPIMFINVNTIKDMVDAYLDRKQPYGGYITIPDWLPDNWFSEMCTEIRTPKGWIKNKGQPNEAWDLLVYCVATLFSRHVRIEAINWDKPPDFALEWDENPLVTQAPETVETIAVPTTRPSVEDKLAKLADLGKQVN